MNVVALFKAQAAARPDAAAFVEGGGSDRRVTSFADVARFGSAGAGLLRAAGLEPGAAVLVLIPFSAQLYGVLAAVFEAGLTAIVLDPGAGREHVARAVRLRPPDAFIGSPKAHVLRVLQPGIRRIPIRFVTTGWVPGATRWDVSSFRVDQAPCARSPNDPALLTFTSGSTGEPRGAVRSHGVLSAQHRALESALELRPGQVDLATLPIVVLANLASGVTTVLPDADLRKPGSVDARCILEQIGTERPDRCTASPAFFERLLTLAESEHFASFRRLDVGGAPVFPDLLSRLSDLTPHSRVTGVYGSTEAEPIAEIDASSIGDDVLQRSADGHGLPVGVPVADVRLHVVRDEWGTPLGPFTDSEWSALELGVGEIGEIVVSGDHIIPSYVNGVGDEETKIDVSGVKWHRTGDAGHLDADGRLWLLGRCAHAARGDFATVYPLQVEAAVRGALDLRSAFLIHHGVRTLAIERGRGSAPFDVERIRRSLEWAHIQRFAQVDALPTDRRHNAKIDVSRLRSILDKTV